MDKPPYDSVYADHYANGRKAHERADKKPRKHAELIKAWADGAEIQWYCGVGLKWGWADDHNPSWSDDQIYRIKPVPKEDYIESGLIAFQSFNHCLSNIPVRVTFDGETDEAKKVEIVK